MWAGGTDKTLSSPPGRAPCTGSPRYLLVDLYQLHFDSVQQTRSDQYRLKRWRILHDLHHLSSVLY